MSTVPVGWKGIRIGDLATLSNGRAFKKTEWRQQGTPIIRIQNLNDPSAPFNHYDGVLPERFKVRHGDLLFAWSGTPGTSFGAHIWRRGEGWLNQHIYRVDFDQDRVLPKFLQLAINQNLRSYIRAAHGGGGLAHITKRKFEASEVSIPPLVVQRAIVDKIEQLFSELDAGEAALERAQLKLERYRASLLKAAVEGKLTEQWRKKNPPEETGEELLQRILIERRKRWEEEQLAKYEAKGKEPPKNWRSKYKEPEGPDMEGLPELPEGWCWCTVDQVAYVIRGASPRPAGHPRYFGGDHTPWITVGELTAIDGPFLTSVSSYLTSEGRDRSRVVPVDALLLTNSGATLGVPRITKIEGCINDGSVALLWVEYPVKLYLHYYLSTLTRALRSLRQGAAQPNLNTGIVRAIRVPLPPRDEQRVINTRVDSGLALASAVESQLSAAMARAGTLRRSVLASAFSGDLNTGHQEPSGGLAE